MPRLLGFCEPVRVSDLMVFRVDARLGVFDVVDRLALRFRLSGWVVAEGRRRSGEPVTFSTLVDSVDGDGTG